MKFKKTAIAIGSLVSIAAPALSVVSCGSKDANEDYSVSLIANPASSMNFIKYNVSAGLIAPTVLPLAVSMPPESLKNKYQLQRLAMANSERGIISSGSYTFGGMEPDSHGGSFKLDESKRNISIKLRKFMFWSNGDKIVAQNYVDTIKAMLDINNSSELIQKIKRFGFQNATEALDVQGKFLLEHGYAYDDPFNYKNLPIGNGPGQFPEILKPCLDLGVVANGDYELDLRFNHKESLNFFQNILSPIFWPINRKHIMAHGGFENFGKKIESVCSSGAYKADYFDNKYGVEFSKNQSYYNASAVMTPKLNFRFISDMNTRIAMYEDGKVLSTSVNKDFINTFLSNPVLKSRLKRSTGIGTIAMYVNQNKANPINDVLTDRHFRQALNYGINRRDLMQVMNLDFSNPVAIYTAASSTTPNGERYLETFKNTKYKVDTDSGQKELPFMISPIESRSYRFQDDTFTRKDLIYNLDVARHAMKLAKQAHPGAFPVTLRFPYNSTSPFSKGVSIVINDYLKRAFNGDVIVVSKPVPSLVYQDWKAKGKWDIVIEQADPLTRRPWDYLGEFVKPDYPDASTGKTVGYLSNRAGDATYTNYFKSLTDPEEAKLKADYNISDFMFDTCKWFLTYQKIDDTTNEFADENLKTNIIDKYKNSSALTPLENKLYKLINDFYASTYTPLFVNKDKNVTEEQKLSYIDNMIRIKSSFFESTIPYPISFGTVYKTIEKIQRDMAPVIPITEADNVWSVSRVMGSAPTAQGYWANPEYIYNGDHRPRLDLEERKFA